MVGAVNPLKLRYFPATAFKEEAEGVTEELAQNEGSVKEVGQTLTLWRHWAFPQSSSIPQGSLNDTGKF